MIVYKCANNNTLLIYLNSSPNIHQRVHFVQETSNFFKKGSQIAAGETDLLQLQHLDLWNELPFNIRTAKSITVLKKKKLLKTHPMSDTFSKA